MRRHRPPATPKPTFVALNEADWESGGYALPRHVVDGDGLAQPSNDRLPISSSSVLPSTAIATRRLTRIRPHRGVVVAQQRHELLRFRALGKSGKAADVAEHDNDLAAMAFMDAFIALRDNEVSELRP